MNTAKFTIFLDVGIPLGKERLISCKKDKRCKFKIIDINNSDFSLKIEYLITYKQKGREYMPKK